MSNYSDYPANFPTSMLNSNNTTSSSGNYSDGVLFVVEVVVGVTVAGILSACFYFRKYIYSKILQAYYKEMPHDIPSEDSFDESNHVPLRAPNPSINMEEGGGNDFLAPLCFKELGSETIKVAVPIVDFSVLFDDQSANTSLDNFYAYPINTEEECILEEGEVVISYKNLGINEEGEII